MSRAVLEDHILFRECVFYLRENFHLEKRRTSNISNEKTLSCICTTFHITKIWNLGDFSINISKEVRFPSSKKALISFIDNPTWVTKEAFEHPLLFGEALSILVSFISLLPVKSPRSLTSLSVDADISNNDVNDIALTLPFIWAGAGANKSRLTQEEEDGFITELRELIIILNKLKEEKYLFIMEVIRLIQLSILVRRDDFGLAYLLLISAIEAVSQRAITRNSVKEKHPKEKKWGEIANNKGDFNDEFNELLGEYKSLRGKNKYLSKRFTEFIIKFCPPISWDEIVTNKYKYLDREWNDSAQGCKHPSQMSTEEIEKILSKAYDYRSRFVHCGTQPPHKSSTAVFNKFFEVQNISTNCSYETQISPNYELMLAIAKYSILKWLKTEF